MTDSIYDQLNAYGTVAKQRMVETFSGDALDTDRWQQDGLNTNGTQAMADSIDDGLLLSTGATNGNIAFIAFNGVKQYNQTGSVMIAVIKHGQVSGGESYTGLQDGTSQGTVDGAWSYVNDAWKGAYFNLNTQDNNSGSWTTSGVTSDTNWHTHKIELTSSQASLQIDGNTTTTVSTNLPNERLQPSIGINTTANTNRTLNIRYMECYNT
tara:strand:- start:21 stop:650 length:630 start_codon:yes stop_codon:yes gene_type:complete